MFKKIMVLVVSVVAVCLTYGCGTVVYPAHTFCDGTPNYVRFTDGSLSKPTACNQTILTNMTGYRLIVYRNGDLVDNNLQPNETFEYFADQYRINRYEVIRVNVCEPASPGRLRILSALTYNLTIYPRGRYVTNLLIVGPDQSGQFQIRTDGTQGGDYGSYY